MAKPVKKGMLKNGFICATKKAIRPEKTRLNQSSFFKKNIKSELHRFFK
jgi:hypothetical protein